MVPPEAIPAATVIVLRDVPSGQPEILMVERSQAMTFAGGALVFPGGRVDAGDHALASCEQGDREECAARIAAVRETLEEVGLAPGLDVTADALAAMRARLHAGQSMGEVLAATGARLRLDALVPFARWLPWGLPHRVFDTRFYLARALQDAAPLVDGSENVRLFWAPATEVLRMADAGEAMIIYPTRRNLERLALFDDFDTAAAHARAHPVQTISPWKEQRDGIDWLCIPEGLGYPVTRERFDTVRRA